MIPPQVYNVSVYTEGIHHQKIVFKREDSAPAYVPTVAFDTCHWFIYKERTVDIITRGSEMEYNFRFSNKMAPRTNVKMDCFNNFSLWVIIPTSHSLDVLKNKLMLEYHTEVQTFFRISPHPVLLWWGR